MAPNLEITATGNVQGAVAGLDQLNRVLMKTDGVVNNTQKALLSLSQTASKIPAPFANTTKGIQVFESSLKNIAPAVNQAGSALGTGLKTGATQATSAMVNLGRVVQDAPFGFIGIANNLNPLLESFQRLKIETGSTKGALTALSGSLMGAGGLGLAVSVASSLLSVLAMQGFNKTGEEAGKAKEKIKTYAEELKDVTKSLASEAAEIAGLVAVLNNETETRKRKLDALKELKKIQPEIFNGLKLEKGAVVGLDLAYQAYIQNLRLVIAAKLTQQQIEAKTAKLLELQGALATKQDKEALDRLKESIKGSQTLQQVQKNLQDTKLGGGFLTDKQQAAAIAKLNEELKGLFENLTEFSKGIKVPVDTVTIKPQKVEIELPKKIDLLPQGESQDLTRATGGTVVSPVITIRPEFIVDEDANRRLFEGLNALFSTERLKAFQTLATEAINQTISNIVNDSIATAADAIGHALAGNQDAIPALFDNLIKNIGSQISELGKYLVKIGLEMLVAKKAIETLGLTPQGAIIAGIGLQILGSFLRAAATKKTNQVGFASGTTGVRQGGVYNVGERGPERIFLPAGAKVQPNNELNAYSGGSNVFIPAVTLSGSDLVIAFNRASQQMNRNN